ncbi:carbohydrate kinase family protein [Rhodohalobacter sp. 614A]|uniref:carbohydrate kinase family protein n=1 Tax=Rhodohalobacter sp. 614A TaxID=2908649 RepID=UPI001F47D827|nr:carbohydrate kinase [Rhodohalobacter sp. 614A]
MKQPKVVCFGEVLWDDLPSGRKPGGAPMNVAYHLNKLGVEGVVISRVGEDSDGEDLLEELKNLGLKADYCQTDSEHSTSTVNIKTNAENEPFYEIVSPVAWDYIEFEHSYVKLLEASDAFVYGSLSARNYLTRNTLHQLLRKAPYKIFDINLREPFFKKDEVTYLLKEASLVKMNLNELHILHHWHDDIGNESEAGMVSSLMEKFNIDEILLTKGGHGACYYSKAYRFHSTAYKIEVKDTVGSGDSFLAAFLSKKLTGCKIKDALDFASAVGGFVATKPGACPDYVQENINDFITKGMASNSP